MNPDILDKTLKDRFQLDEFRLGQREIIQSVVDGKDVLALMPTGGGKSLCFQLPALLGEGLTIVVSPLIALMNDQVAALNRVGIPAGAIHSNMTPEEKKAVFESIKKEKQYILYLSPERVQSDNFSEWLSQQNVHLFAIDEAHCVSQWGHDFRVEYTKLTLLRKVKPDVPMIALTATATPLVKGSIIEHLGLKKPDEHVYGFYRPNLYYQVEYCETESDKDDLVISSLEKHRTGRVIIYTGTRKKAEKMSSLLERHGESVAFYHAGLPADQRAEIEKKYQSGRIRVLAATNAFGMGIDHPDVRLVIHTQMPGNIESYYQEVGRAGRDGKDSTCLLTYSKKDKGLQAYFINQSSAKKKIKEQRWEALNAMIHYAEGSECRHSDILVYFKDSQRIDKCGHCDTCDLSSARRIKVTKKVARPKAKKPKRIPIVMEASMPLISEDDAWRMEVIREWRKEYAKANDMPAFMVFSDKTLKDLVTKAPKTLSELNEVYGLGQKKIEVFGKSLLKKLHP